MVEGRALASPGNMEVKGGPFEGQGAGRRPCSGEGTSCGGAARLWACQSDAMRLLLLRVADEKRLSFTVEVPSTATVETVKELDDRGG